MKKWSIVVGSLVVILGVCGVGVGLAGLKYLQIQAAMAAGGHGMMPETVTAYPAKPIRFRQVASAVGTVVAPQWITLRNEVSGAVHEIKLKSGGTVEKDEVLLELDISVEKASYAAALARCRITESTFKRMQQAFQSKASTDLEVEQAEAEYSQAQAEAGRIKAIIEKKTLRAPFKARVGLVNVHVGQYLSEGTEITTLQGKDDYVHIDFMLPQTIADQVHENQAITIHHNDVKLSAVLAAMDSKADRATRNMLVRGTLKNPPESLSPNDSVSVEIEYGPEIEVLSVPIESIRRTPSGAHVFLVEQGDEMQKATMRPVMLGRVVQGVQSVMTGLKAGEQVISDGSFKLRDGSPIIVRDSSQKTSTESQASTSSPASSSTHGSSSEK